MGWPSIQLYFLYTDFNLVEDLSSIKMDLNQLLFGFFGITMIIIGNIMLKLRMNSMIGLRTAWSMKNETTWKKSQRFGGISFIIGGTVMFIICLITKGLACLLWATGVISVILVVDTCYSYRLAKKY